MGGKVEGRKEDAKKKWGGGKLSEPCNEGGHYLRTCHCPHSSLYKLHTRVTSFLFGFLTLEDGTNRLYQPSGR